jgi:hypothetical protein
LRPQITGFIHPELRGDASGIWGNVSTIRGDVSGLHGNVTDLQGDVTGIHGKVGGIWGDVTGLRGDVTGLRSSTTGLQGDIDACGLTDNDRLIGVDVVDLSIWTRSESGSDSPDELRRQRDTLLAALKALAGDKPDMFLTSPLFASEPVVQCRWCGRQYDTDSAPKDASACGDDCPGHIVRTALANVG